MLIFAVSRARVLAKRRLRASFDAVNTMQAHCSEVLMSELETEASAWFRKGAKVFEYVPCASTLIGRKPKWHPLTLVPRFGGQVW